MRFTPLAPLAALFAAAGCGELENPDDVMGNFEVSYSDNLRIYIDDVLVAEVTAGSDETIEWSGGSFDVTAICGDEGTDCPSESCWRDLAVDQPWGADYALLNFVNLDRERGNPGQRMGGVLAEDGSFEMLAGLALGANGPCAAIGVGTVTGAFVDENTAIESGVLTYTWLGACDLGTVTVGTSLRVETDYSAARSGDYDVSSVTPEAPIDEQGEQVDPGQPEGETPSGGLGD